MSSGLTITYRTEPPGWREEDAKPFRCGRCGKMVWDGDGRWAVRDQRGDPAYGMPGQFMTVHRVSCNPVRRSFGRWWR